MNTKNSFHKLCLTTIFILFLSTASGGCANIPSRNQKPVSRTGFAFDTVVTITIYDSSKEYVLDHCLALCKDYDAVQRNTKRL